MSAHANDLPLILQAMLFSRVGTRAKQTTIRYPKQSKRDASTYLISPNRKTKITPTGQIANAYTVDKHTYQTPQNASLSSMAISGQYSCIPSSFSSYNSKLSKS